MRTRGIVALAFLAGAVFLGGCLPKDEPGCPTCPGGGGRTPVLLMPFDTIEQGAYSVIPEERRVVIRDLEGWRRLWAEHVKGRVPEPPLPPVDFARQMVIAFFLGEKPTSGYEVEIVEIAQGEGRLLVRVEVETPPPGVALLQVLTQPFHLVKLPRSDLPVEFAVEERPLKTFAPPRRSGRGVASQLVCDARVSCHVCDETVRSRRRAGPRDSPRRAVDPPVISARHPCWDSARGLCGVSVTHVTDGGRTLLLEYSGCGATGLPRSMEGLVGSTPREDAAGDTRGRRGNSGRGDQRRRTVPFRWHRCSWGRGAGRARCRRKRIGSALARSRMGLSFSSEKGT